MAPDPQAPFSPWALLRAGLLYFPPIPIRALSLRILQQFHSLFAKALFAAIFSMLSGMSYLGVMPVKREYCRLLVLYSTTVLRGSILDILLLSSALTRLWR